MTTTVLLPEGFNDAVRGLLGNLNGDPGDDLTSSSGLPVHNQSDPKEVFDFGASWAISNESSLFTYDSVYLLDEYFYAPKHDPAFIPVFSVPDHPDDPLLNQASRICVGEGSQFCRYDILVGRSPELGNATRVSFQSHISLVEDLKPVVTCGWLPPPTNGIKEGTTYLQGAKVKFSCNEGYIIKGSSERVCQKNGRWSGEETTCAVTSNLAGIVVGSVVGALTLIAIVTVIVLQFRKQKRKEVAPEEAVESEAF